MKYEPTVKIIRDEQGKPTEYCISKYGVTSCKGKIPKTLNGWINHGYVYVRLMVNGVKVNYRVHRLIAKYFIPNPQNKTQVDHVDGVRDNNDIDNLRWCSNKENHNFPLALKHHQEANKKHKRK